MSTPGLGESVPTRTPRPRRRAFLTVVVVIVAGLILWSIGSRELARLQLRRVMISTPAGGEVTRDALRGRTRTIRIRVPVAYPSQAALEFYSQQLASSGEWQSARSRFWGAENDNWDVSPRQTPVKVGNAWMPSGKAHGLDRSYRHLWRNDQSGLMLLLTVRDFGATELPQRPQWARQPKPDQEVTLTLMRISDVALSLRMAPWLARLQGLKVTTPSLFD